MDIKEYLAESHVILAAGTNKKDVLEELACILATAMKIDADKIVEAVFHREKLMSTGIGFGLAVPHVRLGGAVRHAIAVGVVPGGIADYESLDSKPVRIVVLIVSPKGQHETYIRLLADVVEILKQDSLREAVLKAPGTAEIYRILTRS
jgi:mannitol/fructose-specific phosphotransferase system IIA component (Ntr-type)